MDFMDGQELYALRYMEEKDLQLVLKWRNSDRIRTNMFNDRRIKLKEHRDWYFNLDKVKNHFLIFEYNNDPAGLVYFKDLDFDNLSCYWGFYIGKEKLPKGTGTKMGNLGLEFAFKKLNINKLCGQVFAFNHRSIQFHKKLGFIKENEFKYFRNNKYEDVIRYVLYKNQWKNQSDRSEDGA